MSCTDESLDVILLPGILFYFVLTFNLVFYWVVDVTFFFLLLFPYLFLQALRLTAVFLDSDMGKAIMTASSLHT